MSDRRILAAALALAAWAGALPAQDDAALRARRDDLRKRADSLSLLVKRLEAAARDSGLTAEVLAGTIRLRTTTALQGVASAEVMQAFSAARRVLGVEADSLAAHLQLTLRENRSAYRAPILPFMSGSVVLAKDHITSVALEGTFDGRDVPGVLLDYPIAKGELAPGTLHVLERAIAYRLPSPIEPWLNHRVPLGTNRAEFGAALYRALATSDAAVVRRCAAGDRVACRVGFALDSMPTDRVSAWYDASDLPTLARTAGDQGQRGWMLGAVGVDEQDACIARQSDQACRRMLAMLPASAFRVPMPDAARASLTRLAFETGGARAIERMRASADTTIGGQLAAAAGIPVNELLGRWMSRVVAARPASPLPSASFVLASLACIAVCVAWAIRGQPWK